MKTFAISAALAVGAACLAGCTSHDTGSARPAGEYAIAVTGQGFEPPQLRVPRGQAVTLVFTRKTDQTCAKEVEFASLHQKVALPLNQPVRIALPASAGGAVTYQCGLHMLEGKIVAE